MLLCYGNVNRIRRSEVAGCTQPGSHSIDLIRHSKPIQVGKELFVLCLQISVSQFEWANETFEFDERRDAEPSAW